jgi:glycosyltransferase involved in cell wall biosynthesis
MNIHQMMPGFLYGDALGNQAARIRDLLRQWGFRSQVYAQFRDRRRADPGVDYERYRGDPENILIFHYSVGSPMTDFVRQLPDKTVLYYHNVTPPDFLRGYNPELAALLEKGRQELIFFKDVPLALAASEYNRQEMLSKGFNEVEVMPYFVYFDELLASADSPPGRKIVERYDDGWVNLLFVGRLVPNKRQDNLIRAFHYYHKLINPRSRLFLVGSDANAPGYLLELEMMVEAFDLQQYVHITGPVGLQEGLGGYYRIATIFLCLSEHEGFCIPLLEAMAFDIPVLALKATGVPYALGKSGILVGQKRYDVIGELIDLLIRDAGLRQQVIACQRERLADFNPDAIAESLQCYIDRMVQLI